MGVVAPGNKQVGSYTFNLLQNSKPSIKLRLVTGFALVTGKQVSLPPTQMYFNSIVGLAVVKDPDSSVILAPLENTSIGGVTFVSLLSAKNSVSIRSVVGLALVQYFDQRKGQSTFHSINYGLNKAVKV